MILKNYWAHSGYDAEELYFAKVNRELIERIRAREGKSPEDTEEEKDPPLAEVIPFPSANQRSQKKAA
jgi:hypothetical protein